MFKMGLNKKEEKLIRDKIGLWVRHQELDKFNYNDSAIKLFGLIAGCQMLVTPPFIEWWHVEPSAQVTR